MLTLTNQSEARLNLIRQLFKDSGRVEAIVCGPATNERKQLKRAVLDAADGLTSDNWQARGDRHTPDRRAQSDKQLNQMKARVSALIAQTREWWKLAADQFFMDLHLSDANLTMGGLLAIGEAVIEVTAEPLLECSRFSRQYDNEATKSVKSKLAKPLNVQSINAKVPSFGTVGLGDSIRRTGG